MAPFGSSSDSNTIERGGLLTVLHIFSKKFRAPCKSAPPEATDGGDAAPETGGAERSGEGLQAGSNGLGPLRGRAAEGRQQRARQHGRRCNAVGGTQGRQGQKTTRRSRPCNAAGQHAGPAGAKDCPARQTAQRGGRNGTAGACSSSFGPEEKHDERPVVA